MPLCVRRFVRIFLRITEVTTISTKDLLVNESIVFKEVRLVGPEGEQLGIMSSHSALEYAYGRGMDLVLMAPDAQPPVCRVMDYGKYRFERDKKEKEAKRNQQIVKIKEIQLSCRIDTHDFETRVNQARKFLQGGDKVKTVIRFKGREMAHQDMGRAVIDRFLNACADVGTCDKPPAVDGRLLSVVVCPIKNAR